MNNTHTVFNAGILERLPNAKTMPMGKENDIPVIPMMMVNKIPPILLVSTSEAQNHLKVTMLQ